MENSQLIKTSGTIIINQKVETVFDFFSNPSNDHLWRTEINNSTLNGPFQNGVIVSEYSYLSKKASNHLIELTCLEYNKNENVIFKTLENSLFYLKSERFVKALSNNLTEVFYKIEFDKKIVKHALGFSLPNFIISFKAKSDMKKYLQNLKVILENK